MRAMRLFADGCLFEDFVGRLDPKDPGADRGRAVSPRSRAIVVTFDVATCAAFLPVSVARSSLATSSARDELSELAQGSWEGRNRAYGTSSAARACRSRRSTTTRPPATSATSRSSTTASRWPRSSATACSALASSSGRAQVPSVLRLRRGCVAAGAVGQHPGDQKAADPHLRRHARVVRWDPGRRAALHAYYPRSRATARRSSSTSTQAVRPRLAGIITLADIAYLPLMRCRQLLTWFVTARQPAGVLLCAWT